MKLKASEYVKKHVVNIINYELKDGRLKVSFLHPKNKKTYFFVLDAENHDKVLEDIEVPE